MVLANKATTGLSMKSKLALTIFAGFALVCSARAIAGSNEPSVQETAPKNATANSLIVTVVDPNGKPVKSASVTTKEDSTERSFQTDAEGTCTIEFSGKISESRLSITVQAEGYVPMASVWRLKDESPPDSLRFELQQPATMGGTVVDSSGKPIPGVKILFGASSSISPDTHIYSTSLGVDLETDSKGRWSCERVPSSKLGSVWVQFLSDDHVHAIHRFNQPDWPLLRDQSHKQALQTGYRIRGRVTDAEGFPVYGAHCVTDGDHGDYRLRSFGSTNMNGEYELKSVAPGERYVTIMAEGYAPSIQKIALVDNDAKLDFKLVAGEQVSIELVDPAGKPIPDATVAIENWKNRRSLSGLIMQHSPLKTGPDGVMSWNSAPADPINFLISAKEFTRKTVRLSPRKAPYKLVLYPPLKVTGRVVNKKTKALLKNFKVIPGSKDSRGQMDWRHYKSFVGNDGALSWTQKSSEAEIFFRIEAEGYVDFITRGVKQTEGAVELSINLEPAKTRTISLLAPDGELATQAKVIFIDHKDGSRLNLRNGAIVSQEDRETKLTVRNGKFELPAQLKKSNIAVIAKEGYRFVDSKELESKTKIELLRWSRVEGVAHIGTKPAEGKTIQLFYRYENGAFLDYAAKVDANGKFTFSRVPSDLVNPHIFRQIITESKGGSFRSTSAFSLPIKLTPGETTKVQLGGTGRPVIGKLVAPADYDKPIAQWNHGRISLERSFIGPSGKVEQEFHGARIEIDGTFRFEDVPSGNYWFRSTVREKSERSWKDGPVIGSVSKKFVIEPMSDDRSDTPLDLGKLELR